MREGWKAAFPDWLARGHGAWERVRDAAIEFYAGREPREQRLLRLAAIVLPLALLVFGVLLPLADEREALRQALVAIEEQAAEAERLAEQVRHGGHVEGGLLASVERLARRTGVRDAMTRIRPQPASGGERLFLELRNAGYRRVLAFVEALGKAGLGLDSLRLTRAEEPGKVHVQAVILGG